MWPMGHILSALRGLEQATREPPLPTPSRAAPPLLNQEGNLRPSPCPRPLLMTDN